MSLCDLPPFLAKRLTDTLSPGGDVIGQCAACRIEGLWFFGLMCEIAVLLIVLSACGFFYLRLCAVHLALCVLCCDWCFCFSLCERIFDCCLRSFALARATSPCQSPRAGPQRFLVLVRVYGAVHLKTQSDDRFAVHFLTKLNVS